MIKSYNWATLAVKNHGGIRVKKRRNEKHREWINFDLIEFD